jgi:hypothetical protein
MKDGPVFCEKGVRTDMCFLFNDDTWEKNEGGYCIWACSGQKPPSVFQIRPQLAVTAPARSGL